MTNYSARTKEVTKLINEFKAKYETFTRQNFYDFCLKNNIPYRQHWLVRLIGNNVVQRIRHGQYIWIGKDPVFIGIVNIILVDMKDYFIGHKKDNGIKVIKHVETSKEQEAIDYLKSLGYKIMKPVNDFVEI